MIREFPAQEKRVECGAIQFGDDWPGLFLRGDSAMAFGMYLKMFLAMGHEAGLPQHFGGNIQWVIDLIDNEVNLNHSRPQKDAGLKKRKRHFLNKFCLTQQRDIGGDYESR